jgi:hypothetical protein
LPENLSSLHSVFTGRLLSHGIIRTGTTVYATETARFNSFREKSGLGGVWGDAVGYEHNPGPALLVGSGVLLFFLFGLSDVTFSSEARSYLKSKAAVLVAPNGAAIAFRF